MKKQGENVMYFSPFDLFPKTIDCIRRRCVALTNWARGEDLEILVGELAVKGPMHMFDKTAVET